jgi:hypothetical protein
MAVAQKQDIEAELPGVRRDYRTLDLAARLMRRLNMPSIEDAFREEARQRVLRNRYAALAREGL